MIFALARSAHAAADYVWVEGEAPAKANVKWTSAGSSHADWLSGGKWLTFSMDEGNIAKELPDEGAVFEYALPVETDGKQELWARIGFEFARSNFDWKIDGGEWKTVSKNELTSDLMELDFFAEAGWLKLADVQPSGWPRGHTLSFSLRSQDEKPGWKIRARVVWVGLRLSFKQAVRSAFAISARRDLAHGKGRAGGKANLLSRLDADARRAQIG